MSRYNADIREGSGRTMRSAQFFNLYISQFGYLVLANLLMLPFDLLAAGYAVLTYKLLGGFNILIASAGLIILNIGMAGVTQVCRYIYIGKEYALLPTFFKGIRENAPRFMMHGVLFYMAFAVSFLSISLYYGGTKENGLFWLLLIIASLIALAFLFASYYMNIMTVTMDISLKDTYRNCVLFSFGELKNNLLATAGLIVLAAVIFTAVFIVNRLSFVIIVLSVMQIFLLPSTVQYIITFYVYDDMVAILDETRKERKKDESERAENPKVPQLELEEAESISKAAQESRDEYIFYNGRMIKRSEVEDMLERGEE